MNAHPSDKRGNTPPNDAARRHLLRGAAKALAVGLPAAATLRTGHAWAISPTCFETPALGRTPNARALGGNGGGITPQSLQISSECWLSGNPGLGIGTGG